LFFLASSPRRQLRRSFDRVVRIPVHFRINLALVRSLDLSADKQLGGSMANHGSI
jgi:hypothetical protein